MTRVGSARVLRVEHEEASRQKCCRIEGCAWAPQRRKSLRKNACSLPSSCSPKDGMRFGILGAGNGV